MRTILAPILMVGASVSAFAQVNRALPFSESIVLVTPYDMLYHRPGCRAVTGLHGEDQIKAITLTAARWYSRLPCSVCKPWPYPPPQPGSLLSGGDFGLAPREWTGEYPVCVYPGGGYYHFRSCAVVRTLEDAGLSPTVMTAKEAGRRGYASCPLCQPWESKAAQPVLRGDTLRWMKQAIDGRGGKWIGTFTIKKGRVLGRIRPAE